MRLTINGQKRQVAATTLASVLAELKYEGGHIATAVNGEHVPAPMRDRRALAENDRIEILSPMQGG